MKICKKRHIGYTRSVSMYRERERRRVVLYVLVFFMFVFICSKLLEVSVLLEV